MVTGNKIAILHFGAISRMLPLCTEHLNFYEKPKKVHMVKIPKVNDVLQDIIKQRAFDQILDTRVMDKNYKSLCDIYKGVQRKYCPEKDLLVLKGEI